MQRKPMRGVNLGGWLVLEKWITPSLFKDNNAKDEYSFCKNATDKEFLNLKEFRDHFITKSDFQWLMQKDIEAIRLPIGYWAFGDANPYLPTIKYIDNAFKWAEETGLKILLDLHGAPNSQNGRDHSGQSGEVGWHLNESGIATTLETIKLLANRYGKSQALLGISLLNEPRNNIPKTILLDYYMQAYDIIRRSCSDKIWIVYDDGYNAKRWQKELLGKSYKNVFIDTHQYKTFALLDKLLPAWINIMRARLLLPHTLSKLRKYHPVIIGEWSLTLDNNKIKNLNDVDRDHIIKDYARAQLNAFTDTAAWFFWTYKTEQGGTWSFRNCVDDIEHPA